MTVASDVKQCMVTLKSAKETLSSLAQKSSDNEAQRTFNESMLKLEGIIFDLQKNIGDLDLKNHNIKENR